MMVFILLCVCVWGGHKGVPDSSYGLGDQGLIPD